MFAHVKQLLLHLLLILFEKLFDFLAAHFGVEDELSPDDPCFGYDAPYEEGDFNE